MMRRTNPRHDLATAPAAMSGVPAAATVIPTRTITTIITITGTGTTGSGMWMRAAS